MPESIKEQLTRIKAELDAEIAKEKAAVVTGTSSPLPAPSSSAPANKKFSKGAIMAARIATSMIHHDIHEEIVGCASPTNTAST